jgi:hypothetical protein
VAENATGSVVTGGVVVSGGARNLILAAVIFAASMICIDETIVSTSVPQIQKELGLTSTGVQWAASAYLLTRDALRARWPACRHDGAHSRTLAH